MIFVGSARRENPWQISGFFLVNQKKSRKGRTGKGSFGKGGLFKIVHFLENLPEILENLEILEVPQSVEHSGEYDHVIEILEFLEISPVKKPFRNDPLFRSGFTFANMH